MLRHVVPRNDRRGLCLAMTQGCYCDPFLVVIAGPLFFVIAGLLFFVIAGLLFFVIASRRRGNLGGVCELASALRASQ